MKNSINRPQGYIGQTQTQPLPYLQRKRNPTEIPFHRSEEPCAALRPPPPPA